MSLCRRVVRIHGNRGSTTTRDDEVKSSLDHYVVCERLALGGRSEPSVGGDDQAAVVSKLKALISKHAQFQRSVVSCVSALSSVVGGSVPMSAPSVRQISSRSPSEELASLSGADKGRVRPAGRTSTSTISGSAGSTPPVPDVESCWVSTSPLPPTAVLAALYGMTPLHGVSWSRGIGGGPDPGAERSPHTVAAVDASDLEGSVSSVPSLELQWLLCRCTPESFLVQGRYQVTFWNAFTMTATAAHMASAVAEGEADQQVAALLAPPPPLSSRPSYSLAQQLRRASALLGIGGEGPSAETSTMVPQAAPLLDWPEEFLWSLLVSLLSTLALVHSAGLHFFGQLTAADVLCVACSPTLPRQLEQTWADVAAAAATEASKGDLKREEDGTAFGSNAWDDRSLMHKEADAIFRRFCATAVPSVLLPQATVTAATPCHHVFFVLHPSLDLLQQQRDVGAHIYASSASGISAAQESKHSTPAQQAQYQAADLASVGSLMSLLVDLRARWCQRHLGYTERRAAAPSSELAFLVQRLSACAGTRVGSVASPPAPTALQLVQLQPLRLRTESWYYRRLAEEACDRLSFFAQQRLQSANAVALPLPLAMMSHVRNGDAEREGREARLADREALLAAREAKLNVMLKLYALTHEHLDTLKLPQLPSTQSDPNLEAISSTLPSGTAAVVVSSAASATRSRATCTSNNGGAGQRSTSQMSREDSLDRLLTQTLLQQAYRQADAPTTLPPEASASTWASPAGVGATSHPIPQASVSMNPLGSAGSAFDDELLGLSALLRHTTADDTLPSSTATPSKVAEPWPVLTTRRHVDAGNIREAQTAAPTATAAAKHPPGNELRVTVVEVDLDAAEVDECGNSGTSRNQTGPAAQHPLHAAGPEERATWGWAAPMATATATTLSPASFPFASSAMLPPEAHASPRQQHDFLFTSPYASPSYETPACIRSPPLPNMGYVDGAATGGVASLSVGSRGGGGRGHSKYSALSLLRTPPSARRPGAGSGTVAAAAAVSTKETASFLHFPLPHSGDGFPSSTRPYSVATGGGSGSVAVTSSPYSVTERSSIQPPPPPPQQQQQRRRSRSRGSTGDSNVGAHLEVSGARTPRTGEHRPPKTDKASLWAHQQLTALEEMQMALRAHQPPTPRSRASTTAVAIRSRNQDLEASGHTRSPKTPSLERRVPPQQHFSSYTASSEVTPVRLTMPLHHGDTSSEMHRMESVHLCSSDSRRGGDHGGVWGSSAVVDGDFVDIAGSARPRVLLSSGHSHHTPPVPQSPTPPLTVSPYNDQNSASSSALVGGGAALAYPTFKGSAARESVSGQQTPPPVKLRSPTTQRGSSLQEPPYSLSPPTHRNNTGDALGTPTKGVHPSGDSASNTYRPSALSARGISARGNGVGDPYQRSPPHRDTSSPPATVSTVKAAASAYGASAGIFSQSGCGRGAHRSSSARAVSAHATGQNSGGATARGTTVSTSTNRMSGGDLGRRTTVTGGPHQRPISDASPPQKYSTASVNYVGVSRTSSTTAMELMRRLRANTAA